MSKIRAFMIDLTISAVLALVIVLVLDAADHVVSCVSLSCAERITAAGMEVA